MENMNAVVLLFRWLHILAATVSVGVPIYLWLVLMPAMTSIDEESRTRLREASARRWRILVYAAIVIFLVTGLYNYLVVKRWSDFPTDAKARYHMLFGIKFLLALAVFFILSALAGRSAALEYFRKNAKTWVMVSVLLGLVVNTSIAVPALWRLK